MLRRLRPWPHPRAVGRSAACRPLEALDRSPSPSHTVGGSACSSAWRHQRRPGCSGLALAARSSAHQASAPCPASQATKAEHRRRRGAAGRRGRGAPGRPQRACSRLLAVDRAGASRSPALARIAQRHAGRRRPPIAGSAGPAAQPTTDRCRRRTPSAARRAPTASAAAAASATRAASAATVAPARRASAGSPARRPPTAR